MEENGAESLDGSSIKPVSSLRSHFEQMANAKPNITNPRAISPKPASKLAVTGDSVNPIPVKEPPLSAVDDGLRSVRGRDQDLNGGLQPPRRTASTNLSPSPTRVRPRPLSTVQPMGMTPSLNIEPPQSPPKVRALNVSLANPSAFLSAESPISSTSGRSSPRHFRIPSRPHTPLVESGRSPKLRASQPPSPPPPRRSGEFRRDASVKAGPPAINRAEKPKIASKPISLQLEPVGHQIPEERSSPFSTPPRSDDSPQNDLAPPALPPNRPRIANHSIPVLSIMPRTFDLPPVHHALANRHRDQEVNGRSTISPQVTGDQRPALPVRPQATSEISTSRSLAHPSMPPPPPRPSMDRSRSPMTTIDGPSSCSTPPKRVFSTPTNQVQTPPRSHGRSMTVDRASDRTPNEFRQPVSIAPTLPDNRPSLDVAPTTKYIRETLSQNNPDYPDFSQSNRRVPYFEKGVREIPTGYETRIFDVCGEFICTSGHITRVWNSHDGEVIMTLPTTEGTKIMSVAFKTSSNVRHEGSRLWVGNNVGELYEVDIATQSIVASKTNAHTRREIIKIYRLKTQMWTLDDGGTLNLWASDKSGSPNLTNPSATFRVPKGHTFSMIVGEELWVATGKDIRVFLPTLDGNVQFQVLQRPIGQSTAGEVTSGTVISAQPDLVYFSHVDGKISVYCRYDYSFVGLVNVSAYKITSLASVGGMLWVGFSFGVIHVYDTVVTPWVVKKDWQAHSKPILNMIADRRSFWSLDRAQVVSMGQDNVLRIWDGMLQEDWMENQMQSQEADFCDMQTIKTLVMTWNAGAATPYHLQHSDQDATFFRDLLQNSDCPDILVFGFQELVDLEDKKTTAKSFFKSKKKEPTEQQHMSHQYRDWRDHLTRCLDDYMPQNELYHLLFTSSMVGLFTCIFVKASLRERIHSVCGAEVKRGMAGLHGNKGALVVRFILDDTSLCFINCHLAAGQTQTKDRNADITAILEAALMPAERDANVRQDSFIGGGDGSMIMDHEICILNGDLNYRIDTMGRDTVVSAVKSNNFGKLLERDQLLASKRKNPWFRLRAFHELPITFAPTYKYDVGTDNYDTSEKKRAPAWCDRLLHRGRDRIQQLDYRRHEVRVSDHRPVTGMFEMVIKSISPNIRAIKWEDCHQEFLALKEKLGNEARLDYLINGLGFDPTSSKKIMQQYEKSK